LGIAVALHLGASIDMSKALAFQVTIWSAQLAGALANEYTDVGTDVLNKNRTWFSGGSGMIVANRISRKTAAYLAVAWSVVCASTAATLAFAMGTGWLSFALMSLGLFLALAYSVRPVALSYRGLGELAMAVNVSFLATIASFLVQFGSLDRLIVLVSIPLMFQMLGLMMVVQNPDFEADAGAGKRNLVVRLGRKRAWTAGILVLLLGAISSLLGGLFGLPGDVAMIIAAALFAEAALFKILQPRSGTKRIMFWTTAASAGFYVLAITAAAAWFYLKT